MANEQNLHPSEYKLSHEEQKKGGINSGKSRRRKKTMAQFASMIAKAPVEDDNARDALRAAGINDEDMINSALVVFGVFRQAVLGDMKAVEKWQELTEQKTEKTSENKITIVMDDSVSGFME